MRSLGAWWVTIATILLVVALTIGLGGPPRPVGGETAAVIPPPALDNPKTPGPSQTAVLAGGCFWGVQGVYQHVRGVERVLAGYAGGRKETADYETVSRGDTGHAESVEIRFDPGRLSYGEILQIYFSAVHDPTQRDRQGPDVGPQYRSNVFYVDDAQKRIAAAYIAQLTRARVFPAEIVTRVDPLRGFYPAEAYHQDFMLRHPTYPYIVVHDLPRLARFKAMFPARYTEDPVTALRSK